MMNGAGLVDRDCWSCSTVRGPTSHCRLKGSTRHVRPALDLEGWSTFNQNVNPRRKSSCGLLIRLKSSYCWWLGSCLVDTRHTKNRERSRCSVGNTPRPPPCVVGIVVFSPGPFSPHNGTSSWPMWFLMLLPWKFQFTIFCDRTKFRLFWIWKFRLFWIWKPSMFVERVRRV